MDLYSHVMYTSDMPWDPRVLDDEYDIDGADTPVLPERHAFVEPRVNTYGEITSRQARVLIFDHSESDLAYGNWLEDHADLPGLARLDSFEDNVFHDGPPGLNPEYDTLLAAHVESCMFATLTRQALRSNLLTWQYCDLISACSLRGAFMPRSVRPRSYTEPNLACHSENGTRPASLLLTWYI
jgi:hypothetical protein